MSDKQKKPSEKKPSNNRQAPQRPDQASKVNLEDKANPTKPQQVQGKNVNRP